MEPKSTVEEKMWLWDLWLLKILTPAQSDLSFGESYYNKAWIQIATNQEEIIDLLNPNFIGSFA